MSFLLAEASSPSPADTVAVVMAGGEGSRLRPLTQEQAKPAIEFVHGLRIIDFALSNLANSGVRRVLVAVQYKPASLIDHLRRFWQPFFVNAGGELVIAGPGIDADIERFEGTADAVGRLMGRVGAWRPKTVSVFAADHVYRMDVRQFLAEHHARRATATIAALTVPQAEASEFGVLVTDRRGRVVEFQEKPAQPRVIPDRPGECFVSMGNYVFDAARFGGILERARLAGHTDFGRDVLPALLAHASVHAYDFSANRLARAAHGERTVYWRDVGTLPALDAARREMSGRQPAFSLDDAAWPVPSFRAPAPARAPVARVERAAREPMLGSAALVV
ncbi:MAG: sugar phosphate nucleotidyltransferase [Burkholderiaceae bacterium]